LTEGDSGGFMNMVALRTSPPRSSTTQDKENNNEKPVEPTLDTQNLTPLQRLAAKFR